MILLFPHATVVERKGQTSWITHWEAESRNACSQTS